MSNKKYTVKNFCKKYNDLETIESKEIFIKSVMNEHYIPYEEKVAVCENIVNNTYYKNVDRNCVSVKKLHINSPAQHMLFGLQLVKQYTNIDVDLKKSLEEFNLLNKSGVMNIVLTLIPETEFKEFEMLLGMICNDVMCNEYETRAFISNQVERFGELTGAVLTPLFEQLNKTIENIDEKTVDKIVNKLKGLDSNSFKGKFNLMK